MATTEDRVFSSKASALTGVSSGKKGCSSDTAAADKKLHGGSGCYT